MPRTTASPSGTTSRNLCSPMAGGLALTTWSYTLYPGCFGAAGAPVPGSGLAGVMLSMRMPSTPLTVPRVPLTTYVPVSPLENLASISATEASALSEALSSYRLPSTSNCGRLFVPDAAAAPVKVSLSPAYHPTAAPASATSAAATIDDLFMLPSPPSRLFTGFLLLSCPPEPHGSGPTREAHAEAVHAGNECTQSTRQLLAISSKMSRLVTLIVSTNVPLGQHWGEEAAAIAYFWAGSRRLRGFEQGPTPPVPSLSRGPQLVASHLLDTNTGVGLMRGSN